MILRRRQKNPRNVAEANVREWLLSEGLMKQIDGFDEKEEDKDLSLDGGEF